jgi:carbon monoxide dehydrogenase subunit G
MEFENAFEVEAPLEQVWETMLDVERVAPCVPGAEVLERTGEDAYSVGIKVKVGPVSMQYRGQIEIVSKDAEQHRAVMAARARESRGQGTATAQVKMHLSGDNGTTRGTIATEVALSGRAAAMGQSVIQEVSGKIVDQFAENLAAMLGGTQEAAPAAETAPTPASEAPTLVAPTPAGEPTTVAPPPPPPPAPPPPAGASEGLDIVPIVGGVARERLRDPRVLVGIALLVLFLLRRRRN